MAATVVKRVIRNQPKVCSLFCALPLPYMVEIRYLTNLTMGITKCISIKRQMIDQQGLDKAVEIQMINLSLS
jgi:hypothetical protein